MKNESEILKCKSEFLDSLKVWILVFEENIHHSISDQDI